MKFPVGVGAAHKDATSRRVGIPTYLGSAMAWRDAFRDGKPRRPISKIATNTDAVVCHVQQMLETRQFDRKGILYRLFSASCNRILSLCCLITSKLITVVQCNNC